MPRIISGSAKGIILEVPKGMKTRPTADRAKEALFSILQDVFSGEYVLDLFSGTGSLGLESLSRGAAFCYFVDNSRKPADVIKRNIKKCSLEDNSLVLFMDVVKALDLQQIKENKYTCIFMDPPYGKNLLKGAIEKIGENDIIRKEGVLVVEHGGDEAPSDNISGFTCYDRRNYGAVNFSFYRCI